MYCEINVQIKLLQQCLYTFALPTSNQSDHKIPLNMPLQPVTKLKVKELHFHVYLYPSLMSNTDKSKWGSLSVHQNKTPLVYLPQSQACPSPSRSRNGSLFCPRIRQVSPHRQERPQLGSHSKGKKHHSSHSSCKKQIR